MNENYFPYDSLRENQGSYIEKIDEGVRNGNNIILEAPTGFGKTISILAGSLSHAKSMGYRLVYLSRTHKQMDRVIKELMRINDNVEVSIPGVSMRGRSSVCLNEYASEMGSSSDVSRVCRDLKKMNKCPFYEKTKDPKFDSFINSLLKNPILGSKIIEESEKRDFCPYEVLKELQKDADVVTGSYIYMLNNWIREIFLENMEADLEDLVVVFDEAHNLPETIVQTRSDSLGMYSVKKSIEESEKFDESIKDYLVKIKNQLNNLFDEVEGEERISSNVIDSSGGERLVKIGDEIVERKVENDEYPRSYVHGVGEFLSNWEERKDKKDYAFIASGQNEEDDYQQIEILALDPSLPWLNKVQSTIFTSGTLSPIKPFENVLGIEESIKEKFPANYARENVLSLVAKDVTTKWDHREEEMYERIALYIKRASQVVPKNLGVFTTSYKILENIKSSKFITRIQKPIFSEERNMDSNKNDEIVKKFKENSEEQGAVLLGVMGGRNSEGQDYSGDEMNSVILVGVPYARPNPRVNSQVDYFEEKFPGKGKYYGYFLPAHRKIAQAAGRAHRSIEDKASIIFLDKRISNKFVKKDLPDWMSNMRKVNHTTITKELKEFHN